MAHATAKGPVRDSGHGFGRFVVTQAARKIWMASSRLSHTASM